MKRSVLTILLLLSMLVCYACGSIETSNPFDESASSAQSTASSVEETSETVEESAVSEVSGVISDTESTLVSESVDPIESSAQEVPSVSESSSDSPSVGETSGQPAVKPHMVKGFLVNGDRAMELFGGSSSAGAETAKIMNQFKAKVGDSVRVYAMPIPLACAFYAPEGYENSMTRTRECFYGLRDALDGVTFVDAISALEPHVDEQIYARTDHHWFALGAYYASQALLKSAGVPGTSLSDYDQYEFDGFLGSVYNSYKVYELKSHPETFVWYEPKQACSADYYTQNYKFSFSGSICSSSKSYVKFIYGDGYAVKIKTGVQNGRKMLVIKDSFGNALAPFLVSGFEEVYFVDLREFSKNVPQFIEENGITDVTFALSAFSVAGSKRDHIKRLMNL